MAADILAGATAFKKDIVFCDPTNSDVTSAQNYCGATTWTNNGDGVCASVDDACLRARGVVRYWEF